MNAATGSGDFEHVLSFFIFLFSPLLFFLALQPLKSGLGLPSARLNIIRFFQDDVILTLNP
jgi:hypothetical protein